jgi:hypothetical protein
MLLGVQFVHPASGLLPSVKFDAANGVRDLVTHCRVSDATAVSATSTKASLENHKTEFLMVMKYACQIVQRDGLFMALPNCDCYIAGENIEQSEKNPRLQSFVWILSRVT